MHSYWVPIIIIFYLLMENLLCSSYYDFCHHGLSKYSFVVLHIHIYFCHHTVIS